jgi:hypothetical protein
LPSIWFTDGRVEWVAIDDTTARLVIPDAVEEEQFTTTFDADAGLIKDLITLRYGNPMILHGTAGRIQRSSGARCIETICHLWQRIF